MSGRFGGGWSSFFIADLGRRKIEGPLTASEVHDPCIKVLFGKVSEYLDWDVQQSSKVLFPEISGMQRNRKRSLVKGSRNAGAISQAT